MEFDAMTDATPESVQAMDLIDKEFPGRGIVVIMGKAENGEWKAQLASNLPREDVVLALQKCLLGMTPGELP
jgi:hypothetical protein